VSGMGTSLILSFYRNVREKANGPGSRVDLPGRAFYNPVVTSKERMLRALAREKPDRLPASVHQWQKYHLDTFLGGVSDLEAFGMFGLDASIQYFQDMGQFWLTDADFTKFSTPEWRDEAEVLSADPDRRICRHTITTPGGTLTYRTEGNRMTTWISEYLIKHDDDIRLIEKYMPVPKLDPAPVSRAFDKVGDRGILRGFVWGDQAGCWQHACCLVDVNDLILKCIDDPGWVHALLESLLERKLRFVESMRGAKFDLIETGGGAASSTLISPDLHRQFCLPYDRAMHDALHALGFKVTYHTCGGTFGLEEHLVANGCDASETLAPPSIGGNQEPWELKRKIAGRIALIGGMDQFNVLTRGPAERIRQQVRLLFDKVGAGGGYILSCADHFFDTPPEHLQAYADAARECRY
jgi:uroporphyrinogen decarboxylase